MRTTTSVAKAATGREPSIFSNLVGALDSVGRERDWFAEGGMRAPRSSSGRARRSAARAGHSRSSQSRRSSEVRGSGRSQSESPARCSYSTTSTESTSGRAEGRGIARAEGHDPRAVLGEVRHFGDFLAIEAGDSSLIAVVEDIKRRPPALILVDPLRNYLGGDENSAVDVIAAMKILWRSATRQGVQ